MTLLIRRKGFNQFFLQIDTYEALKAAKPVGFNCGDLIYCIEQVLYLQPLSHYFSYSPALLGGAIGFTHPVGWEAMKSIRDFRSWTQQCLWPQTKESTRPQKWKSPSSGNTSTTSLPLPCACSQAGWTIASVHFAPGKETRPCTFDLSSVFVLSLLGKPLLTLIIIFTGEG